MAEMLRKSDAFPVATATFDGYALYQMASRMCSYHSNTGGESFWLTAAATGGERDMDERLESAIHREVVGGDFKGAMLEYQAVIRDSTNGPEIARALYPIWSMLGEAAAPN